MVCHPCTKKWKRYYLSKGFNEKQAEIMAHKLVMRVEARQRKENNRECYNYIKNKMHRWIFITNIKATILQSFLHRHLLWIGKSYNPDYTKLCIGTQGTRHCVDDPYDPCSDGGDSCVSSCTGGTCACQDPLANSHQVSSNCAQVFFGTCYCRHIGELAFCTSTGTCQCSNYCGYDCDDGYTWNGVACVPTAVPQLCHGDGLIWTTM